MSGGFALRYAVALLSVAAAFQNVIADGPDISVTLAGSTYVLHGDHADVDDERAITKDTCRIKNQLDSSSFFGARYTYKNGAPGSSGKITLQKLATRSWPDTEQYERFRNFYTNSWLHAFATIPLEGRKPFGNKGARKEAIEKTVLNAVLTNAVIAHANLALKSARTGKKMLAINNWDKSFAYYTGLNPSCAPYATADKRGRDFNTMSSQIPGSSKANVNIMASFRRGHDGAEAGNVKKQNDAYYTIKRWIQATYIQATLRYAYKVDLDLRSGVNTDENRGEGWGFWHIVEPYIAANNKGGAQFIRDMYNLAKPIKASASNDFHYFCNTKRILMNSLPKGVNTDAIGKLDGTQGIKCDGVKQQFPPNNPKNGS